MTQNDSGNNATNCLLGSNNESHDEDMTPETFSRNVLLHIRALREALAGKGDDYTKVETTRLLRELTLVANLITIMSGKSLCIELL
jgi:hypothetical protein